MPKTITVEKVTKGPIRGRIYVEVKNPIEALDRLGLDFSYFLEEETGIGNEVRPPYVWNTGIQRNITPLNKVIPQFFLLISGNGIIINGTDFTEVDNVDGILRKYADSLRKSS